ncbi:MAG: hypothetical protein OWU84_15380 [Firmicutes bacterium]|nr:hypothetical protein [Bacillota bacterium]
MNATTKTITKGAILGLAIVGSMTVPLLAQAQAHSHSRVPMRLTITRIGLYGAAVPKFSKTITTPTVVQTLYEQARTFSTRPVTPLSGFYNGYPPGWQAARVALELTFWQGSHRKLTLIDTPYLPITIQGHAITHLLIGTKTWITNATHNPYRGTIGITSPTKGFLQKVNQLLPMKPQKFFNA